MRHGRGAFRAIRRAVLAVLVAMAVLVPMMGSQGVGRVEPVAAQQAPGTYVGEGFDACAAPSNATMDAWLASPYRAVGIYFGGVNRACQQPNLTADWVTHQQTNGWHLLPIYLGLQAPCTTSNKRYRIDPAQAAAQGVANAEDAVASAQAIGLPRDSTLIFDMEAYATNNTSCRTAVLSFISAFNSRVHDYGYFSGFYSSMSSGVADQVSVYTSTTRVPPDYLDFARWNGQATVVDDTGTVPTSYWSPHRRIHQYRGGHDETWGGVTINIDNDYVDVAPLPTTAVGDFSGNGWSDVLARDQNTGTLYTYRGNGTNLEPRSSKGTGWNAMTSLTRLGDFNRDGHEDIITREGSTGYLWLYPGTGAGFGTRIRLGTGWNAMREITAVGDLNADGYPDLVAYQASTGILFFFAGHGTSLSAGTSLGPGWNTVSELAGVGDFNRDGKPDMVARLKSTGDLYLYPGNGVGFSPRVRIGTGWGALRGLAGVGDFNRDGYTDLFAIDTTNNNLYFYPGRGNGFAARIRLGTGWSSMGPLL